jgi:hypothetical protein
MANTLNLGNGNWATKEDSLLAYNSENGNFKPLAFNFTRASSATVVNKAGLIETVGSGEPRIDFSDDAKGALLLEPSRTNSLLQSNQFDTTWVIGASALSLTSGQSGIYGSNNAWLLKKNSTGSRYIQQSLSLSSAQYSYSVYLKAESTNWVYVWSYDGVESVNAYFDLANGVVGTTNGSNLDNAKIESVGNGWYRCTLTYTQATTLVRIFPADSNGQISPTSDNGIYIQYSQLEQGSYATSYIPTYGSAVTRVADSCNNSANAQVINSTEGVLYAQISALSNSGNTYRLIGLNNGSGTNTNRIFIGYTNNNSIYAAINDTTIAFTVSSFDVKNFNKVAVVYNGSIAKLFINGSEVGSGITNAPTLSGLSRVDFSGSSTGANEFKGNTKDVRVYNTALTDTELQALTRI